MYAAAAKNLMLDAIGITHVSLHTAFSTTGANEVTGGSPAYARKSATYAAASGGTKASSNAPVFDVPASTTVRFIGWWTAITAGTFLGMIANGGTEFEFYADLTAETIKRAAHGLVTNDKIVFTGGTPPGGLTEGTVYFVITATTDDFQVAATQGGAAINLTSQAGDGVVCSKIIEEVFAAQGTHTVNTQSLGLNN